MPTVKDLYTDADVAKAIPFASNIADSIQNAAPRPATVTGDKYTEVSELYYTTVHDILAGDQKAEDAVPKLADDVSKILGDKFKIGEPAQ